MQRSIESVKSARIDGLDPTRFVPSRVEWIQDIVGDPVLVGYVVLDGLLDDFSKVVSQIPNGVAGADRGFEHDGQGDAGVVEERLGLVFTIRILALRA